MKLDIRNQAGERLILSLDQTLTIEQNAGWLTDEELPGAKSYPIKFPLKPNERFLQSGYRPEAAQPHMDLVVTARMDGVLYRRCVLEYRVVEGEGDGFLKIDSGEVYNKLRNLSLQDALSTPVEINTSAFYPLASRMKDIASLPPGQFPLTFYPIRNEIFFEDGLESKVPGFVKQPYLNYWTLVNGVPTFVHDTDTVRGYPVVPQFYFAWVLQQLYKLAGFRIEGDWFSDPETQALTLFNLTAIPVVGALNQVKYYPANPGQHLPKMSVGEFLKAVKQRYGLLYSFDGTKQVVTIRQFDNVVRSPAIDLTPYIVGRYGIDAPAGKGFSITDAVDSADELYHDAKGQPIAPVPLLVGGDGAADRQEVKLSLGTTQMIYEVSPVYATATPEANRGKWSVPTVRQPGNTVDAVYAGSDRYPEPLKPGETSLTLRNSIALRVLSYRGMTTDSKGAVHPLGTSDVRNGKQEIVSSQAVALTGRYGVWRQFLRSFYYFRDQTRPVTVPLDLPVPLVAGLKLHEPIALKLEGQTRRLYLIQKLMAESSGPSGLMECKLTALSLPDGIDQAADVDETLVWLEWIVSAVTQQPQVAAPTAVAGVIIRQVVTYTVNFWQDKPKTIPAVVASLAINVRRKRTSIFNRANTASSNVRSSYDESVLPYVVSGQTAVIEANYIVDQITIWPTGYLNRTEVPDGLIQSLQPDPGDGYNLL